MVGIISLFIVFIVLAISQTLGYLLGYKFIQFYMLISYLVFAYSYFSNRLLRPSERNAFYKSLTDYEQYIYKMYYQALVFPSAAKVSSLTLNYLRLIGIGVVIYAIWIQFYGPAIAMAVYFLLTGLTIVKLDPRHYLLSGASKDGVVAAQWEAFISIEKKISEGS